MLTEEALRRGLGYKPDRRHLAGFPVKDAAKKMAGLPIPPEAMGVDAGVCSILNQGSAPFCVSHGVSQALRTDQVLRGVTDPRLASRLWLMYLAHALEHDTDGFDGAIIADAFEVVEKLGFPPEDVWPYSDSQDGPYKTKPPAEVFREAFDRIAPLDFDRILTVGDARVDDVKRALAAGYPVVFGTQVTEAFCEGQLGTDFTLDAPRPLDAMAGGHCMMLSGYAADGRFRGVNSWGPEWGDGGKYWATPALIAYDGTEDIWISRFGGAQP